jgi:pyruvate/2-oxoglutarate dehydrogenase complex dihydrolipoamide dehydrogenase (E3) component
MVEQVDVVVVGMGVGGEAVAGQLAEAGLRVVGVEGRLVGGECPYWGCVPSKMMIRASNLLTEGRRIEGMAGHPVVVPDWRQVASRIRSEATDDWNDKVAVERFTGKGGLFVRGWGRLAGRGSDGAVRVQVDDETYEASRGVVLGVGTEPAIPPVDGLSDTPYWTNRDAIEAKSLPASLIVLGGGAVGLELAQVFARYEVPVTVIEVARRLLPMEEPQASAVVQQALEADGITVHTGVKVQHIGHNLKGFVVTLGGGMDVVGEQLLVATGRKPNLELLGLESVDLDPKTRWLTVDEHLRAGDKVWAVGDVTGHGAFTHVAMYQAGIAARSILGQDGPPAEYHAVPRVTFTDPEVGAVGLTESEALDEGLSVEVGVAELPSSARGWIHKAGNDGVIKLVADAERGVLVGATSAGPMGGEVLSALVVAVHAEVPVERLRQLIYAYPTFHRAIEDALRDLSPPSDDGE